MTHVSIARLEAGKSVQETTSGERTGQDKSGYHGSGIIVEVWILMNSVSRRREKRRTALWTMEMD